MHTPTTPHTPQAHTTPHTRTLLAAALLTLPLLSACTQELALNLTIGQCISLPEDTQIASVTTSPCDEEHHAEVIGIVTIDSKNIPTPDELNATAQTQCVEHFATYVGTPLERSNLELKWLAPSDASWKTGDRTLTCLAIAPGNQTLSQTVKDSQL